MPEQKAFQMLDTKEDDSLCKLVGIDIDKNI